MLRACPTSNVNMIPNSMIDSRKDRKFFTSSEDELLKMIAWRYGAKNWILIASMIPGKTARQCRDRYMNYLAPGLCHSEWTTEEDELLKKLYRENGPKWSLISKHLPNRSPINVKNRWAHFLGKKVSSASSSLKITNLNSSSCACSSDTDNSDYNENPKQSKNESVISPIDINYFLSSISNPDSYFDSCMSNLTIPQLLVKNSNDNFKKNRTLLPSLISTDASPSLKCGIPISSLCI